LSLDHQQIGTLSGKKKCRKIRRVNLRERSKYNKPATNISPTDLSGAEEPFVYQLCIPGSKRKKAGIAVPAFF
jgi:hypothetical protein